MAKKLKPKVVIAENVKGLIQGNAKGYVKQIFQGFREAGYDCQLFLLNAAFMGVPQRRERTFFIANRLGKKIKLSFDEKTIDLKNALIGCETKTAKGLTDRTLKLWKKCHKGASLSTVHEKGSYFNCIKTHPNKPANTFCASSADKMLHWSEPRAFSNGEILRIQTFPEDYKAKKTGYICGMSVPPFMMQRIALQVYKQLLVESN